MKSGIPLSFLQTGHEAIVKEMVGGEGMRRRLAGMGITRGTGVKVIQNDAGGPVIISVREGRLALGRGITLKILVEEKK